MRPRLAGQDQIAGLRIEAVHARDHDQDTAADIEDDHQAVGAERAAVQGSRLDDEAVVRFGHVAAESIDLGGERCEAIGLVAAQVCAEPAASAVASTPVS